MGEDGQGVGCRCGSVGTNRPSGSNRNGASAGSCSVPSAGDGSAGPPSSRAVWTSTEAIRTWIAGLILVAGLGVSLLAPTWAVDAGLFHVPVRNALLFAATVVGAASIVRTGVAALRRLTFNIDILETIAIVAAYVALMADDLDRLPYAFSLARSGRGVIKRNVWGSLLVESILSIAAPLGLIGPVLAVVFGDPGLTLGVTGNALRLTAHRPD